MFILIKGQKSKTFETFKGKILNILSCNVVSLNPNKNLFKFYFLEFGFGLWTPTFLLHVIKYAVFYFEVSPK